MKLKFTIFLSLIVLGLSAFSFLKKDGKEGYTGSPGEQSCNACHNTFALNSGPGDIRVVSNIPGNEYTPGATYQISVIVKQTGRSLFGFGLEALKSDNSNAGTLTVTDAVRTKKVTNAGNGRINMTHKLNGGATADSSVFTFDWTAPATNVGAITFYFAGVAADNSNSNANDYVYDDTYIINSTSTVSVEEEELSALQILQLTNGVQVSMNLLTSGKLDLRLIGMDGKLIQERVYENLNAGNQQLIIPTNGISAGVYVIQATFNQKVFSRKVFLMNN